jgi:N-acetyl sugar amidotransferase
MDTSDPDIQFDEEGICNHCHMMDDRSKFYVRPESIKKEQLDRIVKDIKKKGQGKKYDCIIGVSGGTDSTFVAYKVKEFGLRPLAVHLDNGWDSEISVSNIENALRTLKIDLFTYVIDWEEFKDIQIAFLKASTPDIEIPTDHAIFPLLRKVAAEENVEYIIDGVNWATETIMPRAWSQGYSDWKYIKNVHKVFGKLKIRTFPHYTLWNLIYYKRIKRQINISLLNYFNYNKGEAQEILAREVGWRDYGGKHYESIFTQFYQAYILPNKFGFDKRRAHLSTLINTGQISREEALREMDKDLYPKDLLNQHKEYVLKKLGLTNLEFEQMMATPPKTYKDYKGRSKRDIEMLENMIFKKLIKFYRLLNPKK